MSSAAEWHRKLEGLCAGARKAIAAGHYAEAELALRRAIGMAPRTPALLADLAMVLQELDRNDDAIEAARRALELAPDTPSTLNTLGNALRAKGRPAEAAEALTHADALVPGHRIVLVNLGAALAEAGRPDEAEAAYVRACEAAPGDPEPLLQLGLLRRSRGDLTGARSALERALRTDPSHAAVLIALGNVSDDLGDPAAAESCYREALRTGAADPAAYYNLGTLLARQGRHAEAIPALTEVTARVPGFADAHARIGQAHLELGHAEEARSAFARAAEIAPGLAGARNGLGAALRLLGRGAEAAAEFEAAAEADPNQCEPHVNLGHLAIDEARFDDAVAHADRALALAPGSADAMWVLASANLARGDFARGWPDYESRLGKRGAASPAYPYPRWDGSPPAGRMMLVAAEQGVGDEVMFASCLPDLVAAGADVVAECDARLLPLLARSFPRVTFVPRFETPEAYPREAPRPDAWVPMGSLPEHFRPGLASFPAGRSYLVPDPERVAAWRSRFAALGARRTVGISWRGGKEPIVQRARSMPLERLAVLAGVPQVAFVNVQYGDCAAERSAARAAGLEVHDWPDADPLRDLDGFAAEIAALDLVISVDNSTVHMAGAVGTPAWVLLPASADWRWLLDREDSPWYASVRLFRQRQPGEWSDVLERVRAELARVV